MTKKLLRHFFHSRVNRGIDRGGPADELGLIGDRLQLGGLDQHGGRRGTLLGASRQAEKCRPQSCPEKRQNP